MSTLALRRRRGRKASRHKISRPSELSKQLPPIVSAVGSEQLAKPTPTADVEAVISTVISTLTTTPTTPSRMLCDRLSFGCLNIRSLNNKLDDLLEVRRDMAIDVMCLVETWHDVDSINFSRLRMSGYQVVDRQRPRAADDLSLSTNHVSIVVRFNCACNFPY